MTISGLDHMYVYSEKGKLEPITDERWYTDSIHVYDGQFSVESDKENLVDTVVGLWAHALKAHMEHSATGGASTIYPLVMQHKGSVFPEKYFAGMIELLEEKIGQIQVVTPTLGDSQLPTELKHLDSSKHLQDRLTERSRNSKAGAHGLPSSSADLDQGKTLSQILTDSVRFSSMRGSGRLAMHDRVASFREWADEVSCTH